MRMYTRDHEVFMSTILVIDDMAIVRDPIAASLRLAGYVTYCAKDGVEGLAELRTRNPDLVLLDLAMPNLDGISVLRAMRRDPAFTKTPVILLTATSDKDRVIEAAKLGVRDYLLKSRFSLAELTVRVQQRLAAPPPVASTDVPTAANTAEQCLSTQVKVPSSKAVRATLGDAKPLLTAPQCKARVEASLAGKTLSGAVAEVMMLAGRPGADLKDLAALITRDPVLSVRVLQMANSAAFASRRGSVTTITEAVRNIGSTNVRNIAASVGIFDAMPASSQDGFNPIRCWQHSFAVARLCEAFTLPSAPTEAGVAYLVGLCHDLGEIMFRTEFESEYQAVLNLQNETRASLDDVERKLLGMTRDEILKVILKCIGLPESIRGPIERFQKTSKLSADQPAVLRALGMAETYANGLLLASSESSLISPFTARQWSTLAGSSKLQIPDGEEIRSQVYCLSAILSRMNSTDQAKLLESQIKKNDARIWLARDPSFAVADPLAEALTLLANVEVHDHLPTGEELTGYSAIVVEARGKATFGWNAQNVEACRNLGNVQLPMLWVVSDPLEEIGDGTSGPLRAISMYTLQMFVNRAHATSERAAA